MPSFFHPRTLFHFLTIPSCKEALLSNKILSFLLSLIILNRGMLRNLEQFGVINTLLFALFGCSHMQLLHEVWDVSKASARVLCSWLKDIPAFR